MADIGSIRQKLQALPKELRPVLIDVLTEILKTNIRFGHPTGDTNDPCVNMGGAFLHGTTPSSPGDEFTIAHNFGRAPYWAMPGMRLDSVGSSTVPLTVSRAADERRIYLTSTIADAPVSLFVEG